MEENLDEKNKILSLSALALAGVFAFTGCSVSQKDGEEWATKHGYVKASDYNIDTKDTTTAATESGVGGLNYGDLNWSEDLLKSAIKEYLSGDNNNYREMYSVATSANNKPSIANVEYVLDTETFELFGGSEKNTNKLNEMQKNPNVSLYWTRQLRETDTTKSYFQSYGVQIEGTAKFYDYASLTGTERTKFITTARNYFKTMGAQYAAFYEPSAPGYRDDDALISYFTNAGTTYYSIIPTKIVVTSPYLLFTAYDGSNFSIGGHTSEFLDGDFLMSLLTYVRNTKNDQTLNSMTTMTSQTSATGLKTQATLTFNR